MKETVEQSCQCVLRRTEHVTAKRTKLTQNICVSIRLDLQAGTDCRVGVHVKLGLQRSMA